MLKVVPVLGLALLSSQAFANDIRFTYIDAGLSGSDETEHDDYGSSYSSYQTEITAFRLRGSVGFGSHFYLPASIESSMYDYTDKYCGTGYCERYESSTTAVALTVGAGLHFDIADVLAIYGDISLLSEAYSYDEDGGYDDEDEEDDDTGHQVRLGLRFQPADIIEFNVSVEREEVFYFTREWTIAALQVNFTPSIAVGVEARQESFKDFDLERDHFGGYFRYSFK